MKFPRQNKTITVRRNALGHDQRLRKAYDQIKFIWSFLSSWHDEDSEKKKGKICGTHLVMINANRNLTIKTHIILSFLLSYIKIHAASA